jgi:chorismate mutase / prephenate dehydratase
LLSGAAGIISSRFPGIAMAIDTPTLSLDELRRRIDAVDDRLQDLVRERAELVQIVAGLKRSTGMAALRPGREAEILRRLVGRHRGPLPRQSLVRLWRELLGGMVAVQGGFTIAALATEANPGVWDLARDHFGGQLPMTPLRSAAEVLSAVSDGRASIGILPLPEDREPAPWWPALADAKARGPRVVARLPFGGRGNGRDSGDALAIGMAEFDPSGADNTLLVVVTNRDVSGARLVATLEAVGGRAAYLASVEPAPDEVWHLIELDDLVRRGDPRLIAALRPLGVTVGDVRISGSYARPLPPERS